ncbi:dnaJ homolog subfamily C member 16 [Dendroctonus ponderosae]|uniref:DnaJ homolog subfamily C member 16 n=1 Tax=Dendroctonus ponderosae TaxID=77166 RepID=U4UL35_DENPD|nr:dnaJ homolog subfamily C member 16 [Dendroctonus ponderosae]ERL93213.1 hypothetical protein D910_10509 [Dendroctonus ponderosae]KAH1009732.1 hypothetical protein HUJ04_002042 [Dendroctonus ponderosae]
MRWDRFRVLCLGFVWCWVFVSVLGELGNPYKNLGVSPTATTAEIRTAYKALVKEWHPDKSKDPNAADRFVEIKQSYELLIDEYRRKLYDQKGITEDAFHKGDHPSHFQPFSATQGARFNFHEEDIRFFHELSINTRMFDTVILPASQTKPYLIFFFADWCFPCLQSARHCRVILDAIKPTGIDLVSVYANREPTVVRRLNVPSIPCMVLLVDGNSYIYRDGITKYSKLYDFIKKKLPYKLVPTVGVDNVASFLNGWTDNRVRGLIFTQKPKRQFYFLATAFRFRQRVAFGFAESQELFANYKVPLNMDTVLLFNENASSPVASITMEQIPINKLHAVVSSNLYLALPRLSSQNLLDELCPSGWSKPKMKICVALVTEESSEHDLHRKAFRQYAEQFPKGHKEKVQFTYIYHKRQAHFINALRPNDQFVEPLLRILLFWRRDNSLVKYEWSPVKWEIENHLNNSHEKLAETILRLLKSTENFQYEAHVTDLFDEHALTLLKKIFFRITQYIELAYDSLGKEQVLPILSVLGSILFILGIGYLMAHLVEQEEENVKKMRASDKSGNNNNNSKPSYQPELKLHDFRSESYNALVRMLKPGCRTVLLILDMQSRQQLIPQFHRAVWPYRKNKTLNFAYMYIEKGLAWYKDLLQVSLFEETELNINPRNCVGTVLALNGHRKYFCVFHAKHREKKKKALKKIEKSKDAEKDCESGAFIGFNSESDSESEDVLLEGALLDGLSNWLDRLFEGSTQRYHINYWPEFPIKKLDHYQTPSALA